MIDFFIPKALAQEGAPPGMMGLDIFIIVAFILIFYFIVWRSSTWYLKWLIMFSLNFKRDR